MPTPSERRSIARPTALDGVGRGDRGPGLAGPGLAGPGLAGPGLAREVPGGRRVLARGVHRLAEPGPCRARGASATSSHRFTAALSFWAKTVPSIAEDRPTGLGADAGQGAPGPARAAPLARGAEDPPRGGPEPLGVVGHDGLHAASGRVGPRRAEAAKKAGPRRTPASDGPVATPDASRRPSSSSPTPTITPTITPAPTRTARPTIRPSSRTSRGVASSHRWGRRPSVGPRSGVRGAPSHARRCPRRAGSPGSWRRPRRPWRAPDRPPGASGRPWRQARLGSRPRPPSRPSGAARGARLEERAKAGAPPRRGDRKSEASSPRLPGPPAGPPALPVCAAPSAAPSGGPSARPSALRSQPRPLAPSAARPRTPASRARGRCPPPPPHARDAPSSHRSSSSLRSAPGPATRPSAKDRRWPPQSRRHQPPHHPGEHCRDQTLIRAEDCTTGTAISNVVEWSDTSYPPLGGMRQSAGGGPRSEDRRRLETLRRPARRVGARRPDDPGRRGRPPSLNRGRTVDGGNVHRSATPARTRGPASSATLGARRRADPSVAPPEPSQRPCLAEPRTVGDARPRRRSDLPAFGARREAETPRPLASSLSRAPPA